MIHLVMLLALCYYYELLCLDVRDSGACERNNVRGRRRWDDEEGGRKGMTRRRRRSILEVGGPPTLPPVVKRVIKYELHGSPNIVSDINAKHHYLVDENCNHEFCEVNCEVSREANN